jgi:antitoxin MazE
MLVSIVPIGNSKGIRIPKSVLEQCNIKDKVELEVQENEIVLKPINKSVRENWAEQFKQMAENKEDILVIEDNILSDSFEWEW